MLLVHELKKLEIVLMGMMLIKNPEIMLLITADVLVIDERNYLFACYKKKTVPCSPNNVYSHE